MERIERAAFGGGVVRRSIAMGIFDWLLSHGDEEEDWTGEGPPLIPSKAAAGRDIDAGRAKTQTEKDLRRVQSQYDPDSDSFDPKK